jgi:hypothetical protein
VLIAEQQVKTKPGTPGLGETDLKRILFYFSERRAG